MRNLPITGEYPADWKERSDTAWAEAGHRCIRCKHPYRKGEHGKAEWTPCDQHCAHGGPFGLLYEEEMRVEFFGDVPPKYIRDESLNRGMLPIMAQWRIGTVHHFDGNKANCTWWNLLALCQRCHLTIQSRVNPQQPYWFEHSDWLKQYVAGFYACKYEGKLISRVEATARMDQLLAHEKLA